MFAVVKAILAIIVALVFCVFFFCAIYYLSIRELRSEYDSTIERKFGKVGKTQRTLLHCLRIVFAPKTIFHVAVLMLSKQKH